MALGLNKIIDESEGYTAAGCWDGMNFLTTAIVEECHFYYKVLYLCTNLQTGEWNPDRFNKAAELPLGFATDELLELGVVLERKYYNNY